MLSIMALCFCKGQNINMSWVISILIFTFSIFCKAQVPLIIDTDASFDVDDVVAICLAHKLADRGNFHENSIFLSNPETT